VAELVEALSDAGLQGVEVKGSFDCFAGTSKESVARKFGVRGINVYGTK
jgi:hypothetical protein